jgi:hypothetical protein
MHCYQLKSTLCLSFLSLRPHLSLCHRIPSGDIWLRLLRLSFTDTVSQTFLFLMILMVLRMSFNFACLVFLFLEVCWDCGFGEGRLQRWPAITSHQVHVPPTLITQQRWRFLGLTLQNCFPFYIWYSMGENHCALLYILEGECLAILKFYFCTGLSPFLWVMYVLHYPTIYLCFFIL